MKRQAPPRVNLKPMNAQLTIEWQDINPQGKEFTQVETIELNPEWAAKLALLVELHPGGSCGRNLSTQGCTDGAGLQKTDWHPDFQPSVPTGSIVAKD